MKEFLSQRGVAYEERNIVEDERALNELVELGVMTVPVTIIGEDAVMGYNRKRLEALMSSLKEA